MKGKLFSKYFSKRCRDNDQEIIRLFLPNEGAQEELENNWIMDAQTFLMRVLPRQDKDFTLWFSFPAMKQMFLFEQEAKIRTRFRLSVIYGCFRKL